MWQTLSFSALALGCCCWSSDVHLDSMWCYLSGVVQLEWSCVAVYMSGWMCFCWPEMDWMSLYWPEMVHLAWSWACWIGMAYLEWMGYACWPTNKKFTYINIEYWKASISHTCPYITLIDVLVLFVVPSNDEFSLISPLQLLLLCPNLPQPLHYLEMPSLLLVSSLGSFTLFFLGLLGGLLFIKGCTGGSPVRVHIFWPLMGSMMGS